MTVVNLNNNIFFGTLPPPPLRLLVFVGVKNVSDVNRLKDGKIMIGWQGGGIFDHLGRKIQSLGNLPWLFFLALSLSQARDFLNQPINITRKENIKDLPLEGRLPPVHLFRQS